MFTNLIKIIVFLLPFNGFAQLNLFFQSGDVSDNWSYNDTGSDATAAAEALSALNYTSAPQSLVVGGNTPGGSCIDGGTGNGPVTLRSFSFDVVDISSSNQFPRTLSFNFGNRQPICTGTGWDTGENLIFTPYHDGVALAGITIAVGANDAIFNIQTNSYTYIIPPCVSNFSFELSILTNRRDELLFLDDVLLSAPEFNTPTDTTIENLAICAGELPLNWNNEIITEAGTYFTTLTNFLGCDSLVQLILTVEEAAMSSINLTICENDFPYTIGNETYTTAGNYTQTFSIPNGCDSVLNIALSQAPNYLITENIALCDHELPYLWQGQTINAEGNYESSFTSSSGCDSISVLNVTIHASPVAEISFSATTVDAENPVVEVNNTTTGIIAWAWSSSNPSIDIDSVFSPTINFPNVPGTYEIQWYMENDFCFSTSSYFITVIQPDFEWSFTIPNVFTPNNDGLNDKLLLNYVNYELEDLVVLNRWGQAVFQTNEMDIFWDGIDSFTQNESPEGVYFIQVKLSYFEEQQTFSGYLHLIR